MKINHYFTYYCVLCCVTQVHGLTEKAEPVRSAENEKKLTSATEVLQKVCTCFISLAWTVKSPSLENTQ